MGSETNRQEAKEAISSEKKTDEPSLEAVLDSAKNFRNEQNQIEINKIRRSDASGAHLHRIGVASLYIVGAIVLGLFAVLAWNYGAPESNRFLNDADMAKLQGFLLSGVIGSGIAEGTMRIHWSDCAIYNGPALPAGPCDCGMLELAADSAAHSGVPAFVSLAGSPRLLVDNAGGASFVETQKLPSDGLIGDASAAHLPNPHDPIPFEGAANSVHLDDPRISVIPKL